MEWSSSVTEAITRCKASETPLLILIQPPTTTASCKTSQAILANIATTSLHKHLFPNPAVQRLVTETKLSPVRLIADPTNHDYISFIHFFQHQQLPDLLLVSCNGLVLWRQSGYVSPRVFVSNIARVCNLDITGWFGEREKSASLVLHTPSNPPPSTKKPSLRVARPARPENETTKAPPKPTTVSAPKSGMTLPTPKKTKLQARLPNGENVSEAYLPQTPFHNIRTWLSHSAELPSKRLLIATAFPRYVFDEGDDNKTLSELGLSPSASLIVADLGRIDGNIGNAADADVGVFARGRNALASAAGVVTGFVTSFFGPTVPIEQRGDSGNDASMEREGERERERYPDEDNLRYNGNSTQFGYDDNDR